MYAKAVQIYSQCVQIYPEFVQTFAKCMQLWKKFWKRIKLDLHNDLPGKLKFEKNILYFISKIYVGFCDVKKHPYQHLTFVQYSYSLKL